VAAKAEIENMIHRDYKEKPHHFRLSSFFLVKVGARGTAIVVVALLLLLVALFVDWGRSSASGDQDYVVQKKASPDGKLIAELRRATTGRWEGPDTLYVEVHSATETSGDRVYSKTYECDDFSGFDLEWNDPSQLTVTYGECHESKFNSPTEFAQENKVSKRDSTWHNVTIRYVDSHHVATR
jgi:hypothetical protein